MPYTTTAMKSRHVQQRTASARPSAFEIIPADVRNTYSRDFDTQENLSDGLQIIREMRDIKVSFHDGLLQLAGSYEKIRQTILSSGLSFSSDTTTLWASWTEMYGQYLPTRDIPKSHTETVEQVESLRASRLDLVSKTSQILTYRQGEFEVLKNKLGL